MYYNTLADPIFDMGAENEGVFGKAVQPSPLHALRTILGAFRSFKSSCGPVGVIVATELVE